MTMRVLYDTDFLGSGCDPLLFDINFSVDDTFWTYVTNYIILGIGVAATGLLCCKQGLTSVLAEIFFLFSGLGYGVAGVGHQITESSDQYSTFNVISAISYGLVLIGNAGLMRIGIAFFTTRVCIIMVWALFNLAAIVAAVLIGVVEPGRQAIEDAALLSGVILLVTGIAMICIYSYMARKLKATKQGMIVLVFKALAMVLYCSGFVVQVVLSGSCGPAGYEECFEDCPLPDATNFNHNAIFHILVAAGLLMLGVLECISPSSSLYIAIKTTEADENTEKAPVSSV